MVFQFEVTNKGVGDESQFVFYAQHRDNDDGLRLILDGDFFGPGDQEHFGLQKDTTYKKTLFVQRGPLSYQYKHLDLTFESACENENTR